MPALKFRVLLDSDKKSEIFRDILINDDDNFESFYNIILRSFDFKNNQLASFYVSNDDWDKGHEIGLMDMTFGDEEPDTLPSVMSEGLMRQFIESPTQKFILVHDFLKMWIFLIELQGVESQKIPEAKMVLSVGDAPLEDDKSMDIEESDMTFKTVKKESDGYDDPYGDDYDDEFSGDFENIDDYDL